MHICHVAPGKKQTAKQWADIVFPYTNQNRTNIEAHYPNGQNVTPNFSYPFLENNDRLEDFRAGYYEKHNWGRSKEFKLFSHSIHTISPQKFNRYDRDTSFPSTLRYKKHWKKNKVYVFS